jgi:hypothetical protein
MTFTGGSVVAAREAIGAAELKVSDTFEWDDANKKNGNVQHLREHGIEREEAEGCFFQCIHFGLPDRPR